ncbi:hypothetical protein ABT56_21575 [Photobacterium aquae]|uniref:diguanylate cyclase n=1 Tax=Photobacterium aquae TaxID=1195763 RepID=A0A0J1GRB6_9GAMM|nr:sensor domain-containing diguanylate cyclase [Photobacterium aquae]KLV02196.1 hypothetical protein ABT56_21575 [Photobacterium aquae]
MTSPAIHTDPLFIDSAYGVVIHRDFKPLYVNDEYAKYLGFQSSREVMALPSILSLVAPHEQQLARQAYDLVMAGKAQPGVRTYTNITHGGAPIRVLTIDSIVNWQGEPAMQIILIDLSAQVDMQRRLAASETRYRGLVDGSIQGIVVHKDFQPLFSNQAYANILGYPSIDALLGCSSLLNHIHLDRQQQAWRDNNLLLRGEVDCIRAESQCIRCDGSYVWLSMISSLVDWNGERAVQVTLMDITEQYQLRQQLEFRANHDGLTGGYNRQALGEHFQTMLEQACGCGGGLCCVLVDIDNFKRVNDRFGHQAGDEVLKAFSSRCLEVLPEHALFGRWGGEEFLLLLPMCSTAEAVEMANVLCNRIADQAVNVDGMSIGFTISAGVAGVDANLDSVDMLLLAADRALYQAKRSGKSRAIAYGGCEAVM